MASVLLLTHHADWKSDVTRALFQRAVRTQSFETPDALFQAVLSDVHDGVVADVDVLKREGEGGLLDWLIQADFQGRVFSLSAQDTNLPRKNPAACDVVHIVPTPASGWVQTITAYLSRTPSGAWQGLTFDSLPGFAEIQAQFRAKLPDKLADLARAFQTRQWPDLQKQAHAIKGGAGSFGLGRLSELAAELDQSARREDEGSAATLLARIQQEFGGVR